MMVERRLVVSKCDKLRYEDFAFSWPSCLKTILFALKDLEPGKKESFEKGWVIPLCQ
jgi:hypothetical protein